MLFKNYSNFNNQTTMIIRWGNMCRMPIATYVSAKKIEQVYQKNNNGPLGFIKAGIMATGFKMNEGFKQAKLDIKHFYYSSLSSYVPEENGQTYQQMLKRRYHTKSDLYKLPIIGSLFMLPLGIPIIILYMHFFPAFVSSWFVTDLERQKNVKIQKNKSLEGFKYFMDCGSIRVEIQKSKQVEEIKEIKTSLSLQVLDKMGFEEKKILSNFLFGTAKDGTLLIEKSLNIKFEYFLDAAFSQWILTHDIRQRIGFEEVDKQSQQDILTKLVIKKVKKITINDQQ